MNDKPGMFENLLEAARFFLLVSALYTVLYYAITAAIYAVEWLAI